MHIHKRKNTKANTNMNTKGAKRCRKVPMPKGAERCRKVPKGAEGQAHVFKFGCHTPWGVVHSGIDTLRSIHETNQGG